MRRDEMLSYMPPHLSESTTIKAIVASEGMEFDSLHTSIADIKAQLSIDTATWGLDIYERELNIQVDYTKSYEDRRALVKSKLRGTGKVDSTLIKLVTDAFTNGQVEIAFNNSTITIKFNGQYGTPPNIQDVHKAIEEIKPAHLAVAYLFRYFLIQDISSMTINQLQTKQLNLFAGGA